MSAAMREALGAAVEWFAAHAEEQGYGYYSPEDPHDFSPDEESCSPEEIANHKAACEAWDRGERVFERGGCRPNEEPFTTTDEKTGEAVEHAAGTALALRAPWGIGSYTVRDPEVAALRDMCAAALKVRDPDVAAAAKALDAIEGPHHDAAWYVAAGMLIAAGDPDAPNLLRRMPEPIANAIRAAHAAKAVRS